MGLWLLVLPGRADAFRGLKPGQATLDAVGGAHKLQSWPHNILTGACPNIDPQEMDHFSR
jgi:hypothetical protein